MVSNYQYIFTQRVHRKFLFCLRVYVFGNTHGEQVRKIAFICEFQ